MADFDPDAYLQSKQTEFDPDAYLAKHPGAEDPGITNKFASTVAHNLVGSAQAGFRVLQSSTGETSAEAKDRLDKEIVDLQTIIDSSPGEDGGAWQARHSYAQTNLPLKMAEREQLATGNHPQYSGQDNAAILNKRKILQNTIDALGEFKDKKLDEYYGTNPAAAKTLSDSIAQAGANVLDMTLGGKTMMLKMAGQTYNESYEQTFKETGDSDAAHAAAKTSVAEMAPLLLLYAAGGKVAAKATSLLPESAGTLARVGTGAAAAAGTNVAASSTIRALKGEPVIGDTTQNLTDIFFGAAGGLHQFEAPLPKPPPAIVEAHKIAQAGAPETARALVETAPAQTRLVQEIQPTGEETHRLEIAPDATVEHLQDLKNTVDSATHLPPEVKTGMQEQIAKELQTREPVPAPEPAPAAPPSTKELPTVRLYHGSAESSPQAGRDFTTSLSYAQGYADKAQGGGKVWYVDVPEGMLKTHDEYGQPMSRVVVPDEIANKAQQFQPEPGKESTLSQATAESLSRERQPIAGITPPEPLAKTAIDLGLKYQGAVEGLEHFVDPSGTNIAVKVGAPAEELQAKVEASRTENAPITEPLAKPSFSGTTLDVWKQIQAGEKIKTVASTDEAYADKFARRGVKIELKPEAKLVGKPDDHRVAGEISLEDVARVTDARGRVLYEAGKPPTEEAVARAAYIPLTEEQKAARLETGSKDLRAVMERTGQLPSRADVQKAVGQKNADVLREQLRSELATAYPPVEGFSNDVDQVASQLNAGNEVIVPEGTEVNPAIETKFIKRDGQTVEVVTKVNHPRHGEITGPGQIKKEAEPQGSFRLTQETSDRQAIVAKLPPVQNEDTRLATYMQTLDSKLGNELHDIARQVGDVDAERLRDALMEETRYYIRKNPGAEPPLHSIFTSTRNNFMRLARRERIQSLDRPLGEGNETYQTQAHMDAVETELTRRGIPHDIIEDSEPVDLGEAEIPGQPLTREQIAKDNVDTAEHIGVLVKGSTAKVGLTNIAESKKLPEPFRLMAKFMLDTGVDFDRVKIKIINDPNAPAGTHQYTSPLDGKVTLNLGVGHDASVAGSFLHEVDHQLTLLKLSDQYKRNAIEQRAIDNLAKLWHAASEQIFIDMHGREPTQEEMTEWRRVQAGKENPEYSRSRVLYGLSSLSEFITESKFNPRFQKLLSGMANPEGKIPGRFQSIIEAVRKWIDELFVGKPVAPGSYLEKVLDSSLYLSKLPTDEARFQPGTDRTLTFQKILGEDYLEAQARAADKLGNYRLRIRTPDGIESIHGSGGVILNFPRQIPGSPWYRENFGKRKPNTLTQAEVDQANKPKSSVFDEIEKAALDREISGEPRPTGPGWLLSDGTFLPVDEASALKEPQDTGPHEAELLKYMQEHDPKIAEKMKREIASGSGNQWSIVSKYMEKNGFVRVAGGGEGQTIYISGKPSPGQLRILKDAALENRSDLVHDIGGRNQRVLFSPQEAFAPAAGPPATATVVASHTGGAPTYSLNIHPQATRAQVMQLHQTIGASTTIPAAQKAQLQQQINVMLGPTLTLRGGKDKVVYGYDSANNIANEYSRQKANSLALDFGSSKKPTPEQLLDQQATNFVVEAGRDKKDLNTAYDRIKNSTNPDAKEYLPVVQHAIDNFDRLQKYADRVEDLMKEQLTRERAAGIDTGEMDNYITRVYEKSDQPSLLSSPKGGGGRYWLKGRTFEKLYDAINAGKIPKTLDVVDLVRRRIELGERAVQMKMLETELSSIKAPDGKPIIGQTEEFESIVGNKERITPRGYELVSTGAKPLVVHKDFARLFTALYGNGSVPNFLRTYAVAAKQFSLFFDTFHVGRIMAKELSYSKGVQRVGYGKGLALLEYSDADLARAVQAGDITQKMADYALTNRPTAELLVKHGLNVGKVLDNVFTEESFVHNLPGIKQFNPWVFQKLSRGAMLQTAIENFHRNEARFPERTTEENARQTAKEYNEVFGNLQKQGWAKDKQTQDMLRVILLAPNWAESQLKAEARGYAQLAKAPVDLVTGKGFRLGTVAQGQLTMVIGTLLANQLINYMTTGHSTFENKDGHKLDAFIPGGKYGFWFNPFEIAGEYAHVGQRYLAQHMTPEDVVSRIASNKLSNLGRAAKTFITNKDYAGKSFTSEKERIKAALIDLIPFPIPASSVLEKDARQPLGVRVNRQPGALEKQALQSSGLKVTPAFSPRQEMFALAHPFRADQGYGDTAPSEYVELRRSLDNDQLDNARSEIQLLVKRGKTIDQIRAAVPPTPEKFTANESQEREFKKRLTPEQKELYAEAQKAHKENAKKLRTLMIEMRPELYEQSKMNKRKQKGKDVSP